MRTILYSFLYKMKIIENKLRVEVQRLWQGTTVLEMEQGQTIGDALEAAWLSRDVEARVWGDLAKPNYWLEDGDVIVVATKAMTLG